ncbi:hypothetical protein JJJ17_02300 [Paracoccus caeni]|uniref:Secreted protein n=1 Tax=Paracoccus caeni TaxID=657651 RepID=A0A934SCD3_9RHOB|nr:hypothetical protein [Paracoccus caeni]MBK4214750.1 hypothetical protein [Paracoccus caeni]
MRHFVLSVLSVTLAVSLLALATPAVAQQVDFGDDEGDWSRDGECDDKRFIGEGMTQTPLLDEDIGHDATDCAKAFKAGTITLRDVVTEDLVQDGINFGTDGGEWANDNECDDKRFTGEGMTATVLLDEDIGRDATDCAGAYAAGTITLREAVTQNLIHDGINFGTDGGDWANDNECDDPRFEGEGMTTTALLQEDVERDATDCLQAYQAGTIDLRTY